MRHKIKDMMISASVTATVLVMVAAVVAMAQAGREPCGAGSLGPHHRHHATSFGFWCDRDVAGGIRDMMPYYED